MNLIDQISHHPKVAFVIGGIHLVASYALKTLEIPTIVMQLFQLGAWCITITVGAVSLYGIYKKRKHEPKKPR